MSRDQQQEKYVRMTTRPVGSLVTELAVPSIVSMLVTAFYNLADTFFVGQINTQSVAALGIVFSYMALIQSIAFYFGQGSGNFISRALGARRTGDAEEMAAVGFFSQHAGDHFPVRVLHRLLFGQFTLLLHGAHQAVVM